jgi:hypothetical protein
VRTSIRTQPKLGELRRRRRKKKPAPVTLLRIEWLTWLVEEFGPEAVSEWQDPPVSFREWKLTRELAAHEAA